MSEIGRLPVITNFLGLPLNGDVDAGSMYRCDECSLLFRAPIPSPEVLAKYYGALASDDFWEHDPDREVWREIRKILEQAPDRSILDVGCFRGDFLNYLGKEWQRFGIEPSADARAVANSRGIKIVADNIESYSGDDQRMGAITMIDVIEHLPRPMDALRKLAGLLQPGGQLIIFTGNTKAWTWRFSGLDYWYSAMPEHLAFFNPQWFQWAALRVNCHVTHVLRLRYQPAPARVIIDEGLKNIAYLVYRRLGSSGTLQRILSSLPVIKRIGAWENSWWTSARDHILIVMTKS